MSEDEPSGGFDGPTTASVVGGLTARTSTESNIYFNIDNTVAHEGDYTAHVHGRVLRLGDGLVPGAVRRRHQQPL